MEREANKTARESAPNPYSAIGRACVEENKEITSINKIGLTNHSGTESVPPGLPKSAANGPPPGINSPGSAKSLLGLTNASKEKGALMRNGINTIAALFKIR